MASGNNQRTWSEAIKAIASVVGLMIAVFSLLGIFLPTNLIQPIGALAVGLILTAILAWMGKLEWGRALVTWLMVSMGLIILYLIVSRPATVVGFVIDSSSSPVKGLTLVLTDANGVDHKAVTDENGAFEIKNVSEGKFTISADGELLISGRVPSGWKQIMDSQIEIGSLVHKPNPTVAATPTVVAVVIPDTPTITTPTAANTPTSTTSVPPPPQTKACTPMALNKAEIIPTGMWVLIRICTPRSGNASACTYTVEQSQGGTYTPNEHSGNSPRTGVWTYCTENEAKKAANAEASDPSFIQWWPATQIPFPELMPTTTSLLPTNTPIPPAPTPTLISNCPFRELADEINVGQNSGACATMPLTKFLDIINGADLYSAIDKLDKAFEADIRTGYQYRELIPARIPPAPSRQRVMWGSLIWVDELASGQKEKTNSRIYRIRCNFTNPCIYVILDDGEFNVGSSGRGILLSEPLSDEILQRLSR